MSHIQARCLPALVFHPLMPPVGILRMLVLLLLGTPAFAQPQEPEVPFELYNGYLIIVKGSLCGLKNLNFVLDTGSYRSVVDQQIASKLRLQQGTDVEELAINHVTKMHQAKIPELTWGRQKVVGLNAVAFDLAPISNHLGHHIDLLLGLDVLHRSSFVVDLKSHKISFASQHRPTKAVPFEPGLPYLVVKTQINGQPFRLLMDTGTDSLAVFADRLFSEGHGLRMDHRGRDVDGSISFARVAARLLLGDSEFLHVPVFVIPPAPRSEAYDGVLTPCIVKASKMYFDFERSRFGWDQ